MTLKKIHARSNKTLYTPKWWEWPFSWIVTLWTCWTPKCQLTEFISTNKNTGWEYQIYVWKVNLCTHTKLDLHVVVIYRNKKHLERNSRIAPSDKFPDATNHAPLQSSALGLRAKAYNLTTVTSSKLHPNLQPFAFGSLVPPSIFFLAKTCLAVRRRFDATYIPIHPQTTLLGAHDRWRTHLASLYTPSKSNMEAANWRLNDHIPPTEILWLCLHMFFFPIHQEICIISGFHREIYHPNLHGCITPICFCVVFCFPAKIHSNEKVTRFTHGTLCSEIRI